MRFAPHLPRSSPPRSFLSGIRRAYATVPARDPVTALGSYAKGQYRFTGYFDTLRALVAAAVFAALRWRC